MKMHWDADVQSRWITRLTANFMCGLIWSGDCKNTECPYWDQVSLNNTNQTNPGRRILHTYMCTDIREVYLSAFIYRLFHKDFSSLVVGTYTCINVILRVDRLGKWSTNVISTREFLALIDTWAVMSGGVCGTQWCTIQIDKVNTRRWRLAAR